MRRTAGVAVAVLALSLGACETIRSARDRIVQAPPRCEDERVQIYFQPGAAELTREGRQVIYEAAQRARGCEVRKVSVLGLADAEGAPAANLELSRRRAQSVTAALAAAQLPAAEFQVSAAGQAGAVTSDGAADPLRRRAEVVLRLAPRE